MQEIGSPLSVETTYEGFSKFKHDPIKCTALIDNQKVEFIAPPLGEYIEIGEITSGRIEHLQNLQISFQNLAESPSNFDDILSLTLLCIELSKKTISQVPKISESIKIITLDFVDLRNEQDSVIFEVVKFRDPRIMEEISNLRDLIQIIYSSKADIEAKFELEKSVNKGVLFVYYKDLERILISQLSELEKALAFFEFLMQTLEFSRSSALTEKMMNANQVTYEAYTRKNFWMLVPVYAFKEVDAGRIFFFTLFFINLVLSIILGVSPSIVFEGPTSWFHYSQRKEHLRHFNSSRSHFYKLAQKKNETSHESLYLSTTPYEVRQQTRRIEEAWNVASVKIEACINQIFLNLDETSTYARSCIDWLLIKIESPQKESIEAIINRSVDQFDASQRFKRNLRERDLEQLEAINPYRRVIFRYPDLISCEEKLTEIESFVSECLNSHSIRLMECISPLLLDFLIKLNEEISEFQRRSSQYDKDLKACSIFWGKLLGYRSFLDSCYYFSFKPLAAYVVLHGLYCRYGAIWMLSLTILAGVCFCVAILLLTIGVCLQLYLYRYKGHHARRI